MSGGHRRLDVMQYRGPPGVLEYVRTWRRRSRRVLRRTLQEALEVGLGMRCIRACGVDLAHVPRGSGMRGQPKIVVDVEREARAEVTLLQMSAQIGDADGIHNSGARCAQGFDCGVEGTEYPGLRLRGYDQLADHADPCACQGVGFQECRVVG